MVYTFTAAVVLYRRSEWSWMAVPETCVPAPTPIDNALSRELCRTGSYAVFGLTRQTFLLLVKAGN